jgi:hypothetical protein
MKALVTVVSLALPLSASAEVVVHSGYQCVPLPNGGHNIHYDDWTTLGIVNGDQVSQYVLCPVTFRSDSPIGAIRFQPIVPNGATMIVNAVDNSRTDYVSCAFIAQSGKTRWFGPGGTSCGFMGLCSDYNPSYTTLPSYNGWDAFGIPALPNQAYSNLALECHLPAQSPGSQGSGIASYRLLYEPEGN